MSDNQMFKCHEISTLALLHNVHTASGPSTMLALGLTFCGTIHRLCAELTNAERMDRMSEWTISSPGQDPQGCDTAISAL